MITKLAEEAYTRSIQLKKYTSRNLLFKKEGELCTQYGILLIHPRKNLP